MIKIQQELQNKLANVDLEHIAKHMGYNSQDKIANAVKRIENVLSDEQLNLYSGAFDFRYSNTQFLEKLCDIMEIKIDDFQDEIDMIHSFYHAKNARYRSYVFVDTDFIRANQSLMVLGAFNSLRYIELACDLQMSPVQKQISYVQSFVKQHYVDLNGSLKVWGKIQRYVLFYADGCKITLNPNGEIIDDME